MLWFQSVDSIENESEEGDGWDSDEVHEEPEDEEDEEDVHVNATRRYSADAAVRFLVIQCSVQMTDERWSKTAYF